MQETYNISPLVAHSGLDPLGTPQALKPLLPMASDHYTKVNTYLSVCLFLVLSITFNRAEYFLQKTCPSGLLVIILFWFSFFLLIFPLLL